MKIKCNPTTRTISQINKWFRHVFNEVQSDLIPEGCWDVPVFQRDWNLWDEKAKRLLIDSILRGFDLPKFYISKENADDEVWQLIDGQQRSYTITSFMSDGFAISKDSEPIFIDGVSYEIAGKKFSELDSEVQEHFKDATLIVIEVIADEDTQKEMFVRLQNGKNMNTDEILNAMPYTNMPGIIRDICFKHKNELLSLNRNKKGEPTWTNDRFRHQHIIAKMLNWFLYSDDRARKPQLEQMYRDCKDWTDETEEIVKFNDGLKFVFECCQPTEIRTSVDFLNVYAIIDYCKNFKINKLYFKKAISDFYIRYRSQDINDVCNKKNLMFGDSEDKKSVNHYVQDQKEKDIQKLIRVFMQEYGNEFLCDKVRIFSKEQRSNVYIKQNGCCADCGNNFSIDLLFAHHDIAYALGGKTEESNCVMLCETCHNKRHGY